MLLTWHLELFCLLGYTCNLGFELVEFATFQVVGVWLTLEILNLREFLEFAGISVSVGFLVFWMLGLFCGFCGC